MGHSRKHPVSKSTVETQPLELPAGPQRRILTAQAVCRFLQWGTNVLFGHWKCLLLLQNQSFSLVSAQPQDRGTGERLNVNQTHGLSTDDGSDGNCGGKEPVGGQVTGPGRAEEPASEHDGTDSSDGGAKGGRARHVKSVLLF